MTARTGAGETKPAALRLRLSRGRRTTVFVALAGLAAAAIGTGIYHADRASSFSVTRPTVPSHRFAFPLKAAPNGRYLIDQRGVPFPILGDSPQALIGNLRLGDARAFIADRRAYGFNTLWVNLLCKTYTGCSSDGTTLEGIGPFTKPGDLATPNPTYFNRAAAIVRAAEKANMVVLLDPIETGGWLDVLHANGLTKARAYGRYVGRRFKAFKNVVWFNGNDFQTWRNVSDDALVLAVAKGIRSVDGTALQTIELNYPESASRDDRRWKSVLGLDAAYSYLPTYATVLREYRRKPTLPVFMVEASYEFEQNNSDFAKGTPLNLRRQEYWSALSGAAGQLYGNHYTWQFADGWRDHLDTVGSAQFAILAKLLASTKWFRLVPDQQHKLVTAGYGVFAMTGNPSSSDYVTTAATPDHTLLLSYLPAGGAIVVDMTKLRPRAQARWFDPANGTSRPAAGVRVPGSAQMRFAAPGRNAQGDPDWLLELRGG